MDAYAGFFLSIFFDFIQGLSGTTFFELFSVSVFL
jgi:hypothetical protein